LFTLPYVAFIGVKEVGLHPFLVLIDQRHQEPTGRLCYTVRQKIKKKITSYRYVMRKYGVHDLYKGSMKGFLFLHLGQSVHREKCSQFDDLECEIVFQWALYFYY